MKKLVFIFSIVMSLAVSCRKIDFVISDDPFIIEVKNVCARSVWVDIFPENNDFYYYYDIVSDEKFSKFDSDADFIRSVDANNRDLYDLLMENDYSDDSFEELMLYRSAVLEAYYGNNVLLEPEKDYILYAYAYDQNINAIETLYKVRFTTPKEVKSDNTFVVSLEGDYITVTPSNDDQYIFDFALETELNKSYYGNPLYYFNQMIEVYEQYGFIDNVLSKGTDTDYLFDYYTSVEDGEKIYVMVAGYDNGFTTDISVHEAVYTKKKE